MDVLHPEARRQAERGQPAIGACCRSDGHRRSRRALGSRKQAKRVFSKEAQASKTGRAESDVLKRPAETSCMSPRQLHGCLLHQHRTGRPGSRQGGRSATPKRQTDTTPLNPNPSTNAFGGNAIRKYEA
jgi:hypothetical protein